MLNLRQATGIFSLCMTATQCAAIVAPLAAFQFWGWLRFCAGRDVSSAPAWCADRVPYIYGYVQSHYWGVGLLKFWQISQASPSMAELLARQYAEGLDLHQQLSTLRLRFRISCSRRRCWHYLSAAAMRT